MILCLLVVAGVKASECMWEKNKHRATQKHKGKHNTARENALFQGFAQLLPGKALALQRGAFVAFRKTDFQGNRLLQEVSLSEYMTRSPVSAQRCRNTFSPSVRTVRSLFFPCRRNSNRSAAWCTERPAEWAVLQP